MISKEYIKNARIEVRRRFWGKRNATLYSKIMLHKYKDIIEQNQSFCPIIKEPCRKDCECHVTGNIFAIEKQYHSSKKLYTTELEIAYCSNAMFHGFE